MPLTVFKPFGDDGDGIHFLEELAVFVFELVEDFDGGVEFDASLTDRGVADAFFENGEGERLVECAFKDSSDAELALHELCGIPHAVQSHDKSGRRDAKDGDGHDDFEEHEARFLVVWAAGHLISNWLSLMVALSGW